MQRVALLGGLMAVILVAGIMSQATIGEDVAARTGKEAPIAQVRTVQPRPIAPFLGKSVEWLVEAQHENGGWGGGSHAKQQNRDPLDVTTDPTTTSFAAMALLRSGHTPTSGSHQEALLKATEHLIKVVEDAPVEGPKITDVTGTQPQAKLGQMVDTTMTTQFLARVAAEIPEDHELHPRVEQALAKCVKKLEASQNEDGSWNVGGGWAPVLQSSAGQTALELAQASGQKVDRDRLDKARDYQRKNFNAETGEVDASKGAGVALYAFSGAQRGNAADSRAADDVLEKAKKEGKVAQDAEVNEESLRRAGLNAPTAAKLAQAKDQNDKQIDRLNDDNLLRGFGNNGGEEFVSFLLTSESMIIAGGDKWAAWNDKMHGVLKKVQNPDGSWSGHHCITSPVFCTAAVVQCLTTDRDATLLEKIAAQAVETNEAVASAESAGQP